MKLLPKVLFYLQNIPIIKDNKHFDKWQKKIKDFIWSGRGETRVKMKYLMDDRTRVGLQIPNFKLYQDAICLAWIKNRTVPSNKRLLNIEGFNKKFGWHS